MSSAVERKARSISIYGSGDFSLSGIGVGVFLVQADTSITASIKMRDIVSPRWSSFSFEIS
jgi:hypothetical protein